MFWPHIRASCRQLIRWSAALCRMWKISKVVLMIRSNKSRLHRACEENKSLSVHYLSRAAWFLLQLKNRSGAYPVSESEDEFGYNQHGGLQPSTLARQNQIQLLIYLSQSSVRQLKVVTWQRLSLIFGSVFPRFLQKKSLNALLKPVIFFYYI